MDSLKGELSPLREMLLSLKDETDRVRGLVSELKESPPSPYVELTPLKDMLLSLKHEAEQVRGLVTELKNSPLRSGDRPAQGYAAR
jgi:hypothetical protein